MVPAVCQQQWSEYERALIVVGGGNMKWARIEYRQRKDLRRSPTHAGTYIHSNPSVALLHGVRKYSLVRKCDV